MLLTENLSKLQQFYPNVFDYTGDIKTAHCCTAGTSSCCNHIDAALYKIEFANREGFTDPSCTEELCGWNKNLKEIKPVKIKDMDTQEHNREKQNKLYVINNNVKNTLTQELKVIVM